jgi:hypothetical protein
VPNEDQADSDGDGVGDACPTDRIQPFNYNVDEGVDISDAIGVLSHLFLGGDSASPPCGDRTLDDEGNLMLLDANGDGGVDISDAVWMLQHLFSGGPQHVLGAVDDCIVIPGCPPSPSCEVVP